MNSLLVHTLSKRREREKERKRSDYIDVHKRESSEGEKKENERFLPLTKRVSWLFAKYRIHMLLTIYEKMKIYV
jgi:hypothetical protein